MTTNCFELLAHRSSVTKERKALPLPTNVLVVEPQTGISIKRLSAIVRIIFGYDGTLRTAASLETALDLITDSTPELIILEDDVIAPDATDVMALRQAKFEGPIIVVSGQWSRARRNELCERGATEVLDKDDLDSVQLAESIISIYRPR